MEAVPTPCGCPTHNRSTRSRRTARCCGATRKTRPSSDPFATGCRQSRANRTDIADSFVMTGLPRRSPSLPSSPMGKPVNLRPSWQTSARSSDSRSRPNHSRNWVSLTPLAAPFLRGAAYVRRCPLRVLQPERPSLMRSVARMSSRNAIASSFALESGSGLKISSGVTDTDRLSHSMNAMPSERDIDPIRKSGFVFGEIVLDRHHQPTFRIIGILRNQIHGSRGCRECDAAGDPIVGDAVPCLC